MGQKLSNISDEQVEKIIGWIQAARSREKDARADIEFDVDYLRSKGIELEFTETVVIWKRSAGTEREGDNGTGS
jgi:hypothetical protein